MENLYYKEYQEDLNDIKEVFTEGAAEFGANVMKVLEKIIDMVNYLLEKTGIKNNVVRAKVKNAIAALKSANKKGVKTVTCPDYGRAVAIYISGGSKLNKLVETTSSKFLTGMSLAQCEILTKKMTNAIDKLNNDIEKVLSVKKTISVKKLATVVQAISTGAVDKVASDYASSMRKSASLIKKMQKRFYGEALRANYQPGLNGIKFVSQRGWQFVKRHKASISLTVLSIALDCDTKGGVYTDVASVGASIGASRMAAKEAESGKGMIKKGRY